MISVALRPGSGNAPFVHSFPQAASNTWSSAARVLWPLSEHHQAHNQSTIEVPDSYTALVQVKFPERHPLRFRGPSLTLRVSDEDHDGVFVVTDTFSRVYGEGDNDIAAVKDYLASLLARFLDLERNERVLAPGLQKDLASMRRYIVRVK